MSFGTAGCNLTCKFCQNWDISKARELDRLQDAASPEDIVEAAIATGSRSIAYTYNDPVIFLEYAVDVARVARRRGRSFTPSWTPPMSTSRRSPRRSTSGCAPAISAPSSKRSSI
ncbi:radical SAM protein [Bradyrhizobium sp. RDI18]|uniref:radical SAM protein n=1 Tax=Bradyrhizobium sp. RDI18 TaxID=3367400 RepID=UPI00371367A6